MTSPLSTLLFALSTPSPCVEELQSSPQHRVILSLLLIVGQQDKSHFDLVSRGRPTTQRASVVNFHVCPPNSISAKREERWFSACCSPSLLSHSRQVTREGCGCVKEIGHMRHSARVPGLVDEMSWERRRRRGNEGTWCGFLRPIYALRPSLFFPPRPGTRSHE